MEDYNTIWYKIKKRKISPYIWANKKTMEHYNKIWYKIKKRSEILEKINLLNGKFFTVEFIKKDNTLRRMNCRTGVKKYLIKNGRKIKTVSPFENGILKVYDLGAKGYRSINIDTIKSIKYSNIELRYK